MRMNLGKGLAALAAIVVSAGALAQTQAREAAAEREAKLALPLRQDGSLDVRAAARDAKAEFAAGVTEVQFRDRGLDGEELRDLARRLDGSTLRELAAALPDDGVERSLRLRAGDAEIRLQRNEEGRLRARIEDLPLGSLSAGEREALARRLAEQAGLDRVRLRGVDAEGRRLRVEFRADRGIVRNEARGGRDERADKRERPERLARAERVERVERAERGERAERVERPDRSGRR